MSLGAFILFMEEVKVKRIVVLEKGIEKKDMAGACCTNAPIGRMPK